MRRQRSVAVQEIFLPSAPLGFQGRKVLMGKWDLGPSMALSTERREDPRLTVSRFLSLLITITAAICRRLPPGAGQCLGLITPVKREEIAWRTRKT